MRHVALAVQERSLVQLTLARPCREESSGLAVENVRLLPSEPLKVAVRYYNNHGDALFRFVDDPIVPIDNSPTEREFQNVAKLRLNMLAWVIATQMAPSVSPVNGTSPVSA